MEFCLGVLVIYSIVMTGIAMYETGMRSQRDRQMTTNAAIKWVRGILRVLEAEGFVAMIPSDNNPVPPETEIEDGHDEDVHHD
jgi:type IV secretory pathway VirB2 component (pilin)